jgi:hypothetical protein
MDQRSTPLNHLNRPGGDQVDEMVQDIENENYENDQYDPPMDQMPQQQQQQQQPPQHFQGPPPPGFYGGPPPPGYHQPMYPPAAQMRGPQPQPQLDAQPLSKRILEEAKEPLLVSVLVIIMSSPQLQALISKFLPIANGNPLIGLGLRALVAGVVFYLLRRFLP